jgi:hypothetical protein
VSAPEVDQFLNDPNLVGEQFTDPSWDRWKAILSAAFGLPLLRPEQRLFGAVAGGRRPPSQPVAELVCVVGRGGGKNRAGAAVATYLATTSDLSRIAPGENPAVMCLATDRDQAGIAMSAIRGCFDASPLLRTQIKSTGKDRFRLRNNVDIIVTTNSLRATRGKTIIAAIYDECAYWLDENYMNPAIEVDAAVGPGLLRFPGSMKIMISSAYRREGLLWNRYNDYFGKDDPDTLVVHGTSRDFNPTLPQAKIDRELAKDRPRASAEYLSEWRDDISGLVSREIVEGLVDRGVRQRPYDPAIRNYVAFADEAGGLSSTGDSSTLCIAHAEGAGRLVQDVMLIFEPPYDSSAAIQEKSRVLGQYHLRRVTCDKWGSGLAASVYKRSGITAEQNAKLKSEIYLDLLPLISAGRPRLLDEPTQLKELCALQRRVAWGGKESVDHPRGHFHDDAANALAGALVLAASARSPMVITPAAMAAVRRRSPTLQRRLLDPGTPTRTRMKFGGRGGGGF